ncbi:MAG: hypothetical protein U5Q44_05375 [Dehalococcoidia bacterium]|nr:hypothetical protein [Dehalococcoidia bacterium]
MATPRNPQRARELLQLQADRIPWLRGSGPNPFEYDRWQSRTEELVDAIFGQDSPEAERYYEAVGIRGRLAGVRGLANNMSLNIHGQWGILSRLERAEQVLKDFDAELAQAA